MGTCIHEPWRRPCTGQDCQAPPLFPESGRRAGPEMHLPSLPILVEWLLLMLGPTAAAASTASAPAGPSVLRLEIRSVCTIESQEYTCEADCFITELDTEVMRAFLASTTAFRILITCNGKWPVANPSAPRFQRPVSTLGHNVEFCA